MDGLLLALIIIVWMMSLPLSWQTGGEDIREQLAPKVEQDSESDKLKITLFPSRTGEKDH